MGNKFEDLIAWQKTRTVQKEIILTFNKLQQSWFKEQLFRVVLSVSNNISEGFERRSNKESINY
jgi:four helix bundle protein